MNGDVRYAPAGSADNEVGKFLENSAMNIAAKNLAAEQTNFKNDSFLDRSIGTYKIERMLGAGGMGEVHPAHDARTDRKVALKILRA